MSSVMRAARHIIDPLQHELGRLRLKVEQLQDQVRAERRRANRLEEALAFERQQHQRRVRQGLNGASRG